MGRPSNARLGPHIKQRHNRLYAVLAVPRDVQPRLGKTRFIETLGTSDPVEARRRAPLLVARWRKAIAEARDDGKGRDVVEWYRERLATADAAEREDLLMHLEEVAEKIAEPGGIAVEEAKLFYGKATGKIVPTDAHLEDWLKSLPDEAKTKDLKRIEVRRLAAKLPYLSDLSRKAVRDFYVGELEGGFARATIARALSACRGYWAYLQAEGVVSEYLQPFSKLALPRPERNGNGHGGSVRRKEFDPGDVVKLLKEAKRSGDKELADTIELAMYSGARIEELASLAVDKVNLKAGYFDIGEAKTEAGVRQVPIHPNLRPILRRLIGKRTDGYVLETLTPNKYGDRSNAVGKRFGRLKGRLGFGREHVFHSIRRTVVTILENADVPESIVADIVGHQKRTMTYGLYSGGSSLERKAEAIEKLCYPHSKKTQQAP